MCAKVVRFEQGTKKANDYYDDDDEERVGRLGSEPFQEISEVGCLRNAKNSRKKRNWMHARMEPSEECVHSTVADWGMFSEQDALSEKHFRCESSFEIRLTFRPVYTKC